MKFAITNHSTWTDGKELLNKYPNLSKIGKYYIDENDQLIIELDDFSIVQKILTTVYDGIVIETGEKYDYRIIIYDGYIE